jgi:hypothetical protein
MAEKGIAMAILGIVALIAVVGLVLLFRGATGDVSYSYEKPYTFIEQPGERLCQNMDCEDGHGALLIGEETRQDGEYWVCGCPSQYQDRQIKDWSNTYKGDESHGELEFSYDWVWRVRKIREY